MLLSACDAAAVDNTLRFPFYNGIQKRSLEQRDFDDIQPSQVARYAAHSETLVLKQFPFLMHVSETICGLSQRFQFTLLH